MFKGSKYAPKHIHEKSCEKPTDCSPSPYFLEEEKKKQFKKELLGVFKKFGYLEENKDYEVKFKTTSGNIAWVNINRIEIIK